MGKSVYRNNLNKLLIVVFTVLLAVLLCFPFIGWHSASAENVEMTNEIEKKEPRIHWLDASKDLPYNYLSVIGFKVKVKYLKDNTDAFTGSEQGGDYEYLDPHTNAYGDYCGYGGKNGRKGDPDPAYPRDANDTDPNLGKSDCYILSFIKGQHDTTELNRDAFDADGGMYEQWVDAELGKKEIVKFGVGTGWFIAQYLPHGKSVSESAALQKGEEITLTYEGKTALFEEGDPYLTAFGYTSEFEVISVEWITGVPVIETPVEWDTVEKTQYNDVSTVEKAENQNGKNYVNIITPKEGAGPFPVILWVHGGAWTSSDRNSVIINTTMEYFLAQGYAFVSADYTLTEISNGDTTTTHNDTLGKQMIYDLKLAVRFLRANAQQYKLDTSFITAMGESAGAHLSLLLATTNDSYYHEAAKPAEMDWKEYSSNVQAAVAYSGPTDMVAGLPEDQASAGSAKLLQEYKSDYPLIPEEQAIEFGNIMSAYYVLGYDYVTAHTNNGIADEELIEAEKFMSPYWQVNSDTPPIYLIHGESDEAVSIYNAYALEVRAKRYMDSDDVKTAYYPDAGHVDKNYFDAYAQYSDTCKFVSDKRAEADNNGNGGKDPNKGGNNNDTNKGLIIGLSIGGAVIVVGVVLAVVFILRKKKAVGAKKDDENK